MCLFAPNEDFSENFPHYSYTFLTHFQQKFGGVHSSFYLCSSKDFWGSFRTHIDSCKLVAKAKPSENLYTLSFLPAINTIAIVFVQLFSF